MLVMIPKTIHQTWRSDKLPSIFQNIYDKNKSLNKEFDFKMWCHSPGPPDIDEFIQKEYSDIYHIFRRAKFGVQKADIARLAILHYYGGVYFDLDMLCLKNISDLIDFESDYIFLSLEPKEQTMKIWKKEDVLCNAFIASPPKHPLITEALNKIKVLFFKNGDNIFNVFNIFGADLIASCMTDELQQKCRFVNRKIIYPINDPKFDDLLCSQTDILTLKHAVYKPETYMVHYWIHSDFESKELLENFSYDDTKDIHKNIYTFFTNLYPNNKFLKN